MKRLEYITNQIQYINFLFLLTFIVILYSCSKDNSSPELNQEFLGNSNTYREYETTRSYLEANSNIPFLNVPDSLINNLSIDSAQISEGVVEKWYYEETLIPIDTTSYQNSSYPELIKEALRITRSKLHIDIEDEIECIINGEEYNPNESNGTMGGAWVENNSIMGNIFSDDLTLYLKKPLYVGASWIRDSNSYVNESGESKLRETICNVVSKEYITVRAGTFLAFKVEYYDQITDLKSTSPPMYEYYVPGVGLILIEYDMNIYRTIISFNGQTETIYLRTKFRKELVSYNFL